MNRIEARFHLLSGRGQRAFIPYIVVGDPTLDMTTEIVLALERAGADIIEFGVPFSDPLADGVANQEGALRALRNRVSLRDCIALVGKLRNRTQIPILLFTYFNPVLAYGIERLAEDARAVGVDGVLCVDLPPEEAAEYKQCLDARGLAAVYLVAPTSTPARIELIARASTGFIYCVSRTGVTGERNDIEQSVPDMVGQIKAHTNKPVAVGFGISTPEQAAEIAAYADGVVVGSAIVRLIGECGRAPETVSRVEAFAKSLALAVHGAPHA